MSSPALAVMLACFAHAAHAQDAKVIQLDEIEIDAAKTAAAETASGPIGACFYGDRRRALFSLAYRW